MLDQFYISIFNHYKKSLGKRSLIIALVYINFLEVSIILALAAFFMAFAAQMKMDVMSVTKFWVLICLISGFVIFKNWMRYNGKKRMVLNAKRKSKSHSIFILWLLPFAGLAIGLILLQAL